ncbi:MAG: hypothetical protein JWM59_3576 [Verrucomicrobiales bacterium]|nr:hypothetical protein [Verrucomicrobiales bacterium]
MQAPSRLLPFFLTSVLAFSGGMTARLGAQESSRKGGDPESYRRYALTHDGNVVNGQRLFNDATLLCANCHSAGGQEDKAGPNLSAAGDAFGRRDLVQSVLFPSATISPGYGAVFVETKDGAAWQGTLKNKTDAGLELMGVDGKRISIASADIKQQTALPISLMPERLQNNLTLQEFTDLIEYLTTLKQADSTLVSNHGMPADIPALAKPVALRPFFASEFKFPRERAESGLTSMRQMPGSSDVFFVLHQRGTVWRVVKTAEGEERTVFADLPTEVFSERGPNGMLDMAFHPHVRENRKYYLFYQVFEDGKVTTHIVEKEFSPDFKTDSGKPPRLILKIASVAEDHSGGCLEFGPDGMLYLVMGDTGPHNDPNGHAQNLQLLLGKMLRIDVDHQDPGLAYAIPKDNPFMGQPDARPEIWAYGLRNPWRFSFDRQTGDLWLADVGQDRVEEVDIIQKGGNYGWSVYEGYEPFSNQYRKEGRTFLKPVFAYRRKYGNSITGGHVYRGDKNSPFNGVYVCADYTSKLIFGLTLENGALKTVRRIGKAPQRIVSFSEDAAGNLYVVGYEGAIYRIDFTEGRFE